MPDSKSKFEAHKLRTQRVSSTVRSFHKRQQPFRIYHGSTSSTRRTKHDPKKVVSTSDFSNVLSVNPMTRIATVEPNVSMEALVDATLAVGLVPPVVMEFTSITVGGGFSGTSGESSSFRHGVFDNTVRKIEIVLGDGEVVNASTKENSELFTAAAGCFGTMGVVTLLEVQLVEAEKYVECEYAAVSGPEHAIEVVEKFTADASVDYIDGIMFSKTSGVVIAGRRTSKPKPGLRVQNYLGAWDQWFYIRAEEILTTNLCECNKTYKELVPIKDYLFRYNRGAFWGGKYCFSYFVTPFNRLTRWLLDDILHTKAMYHALHKSGLANEYIVQDIGFPYTTTPDFLNYLDTEFGFYPIWLCPLQMRKPYPLTPKADAYTTDEKRVMNIGVWGPGPRDRKQFIAANRAIEAKTRALQGLKCLYAHAYYTAAEFWDTYDKEEYDTLRTKYKAAALPSVFEKVTSNDVAKGEGVLERLKNVWPVRGLYGAVAMFWENGDVSRVHRLLSLVFLPLLVGIVVLAWVLAVWRKVLGGGLRMVGLRKKKVE